MEAELFLPPHGGASDTLIHDVLRVVVESNTLAPCVHRKLGLSLSLVFVHSPRHHIVRDTGAILRWMLRYGIVVDGSHSSSLEHWDMWLEGKQFDHPWVVQAQERSHMRIRQLALLNALQQGNNWDYSPATKRVHSALDALFLPFLGKRVPQDYYQRSLQERASCLGTTIHHLYKTLIVENGRVSPPQYAALIVPYASEGFDPKVLNRFWRSHAGMAKASVNWRLSDAGAALVGFGHNGVAPVGMLTELPLIIDTNHIPAHIWLGGGEEDVKILLNVDRLAQAVKALRTDLTGRSTDDD